MVWAIHTLKLGKLYLLYLINCYDSGDLPVDCFRAKRHSGRVLCHDNRRLAIYIYGEI